ncbi:hypothetical protein L596_009236 [Steinernema carpocapsae]|uniref:Uncharacterized protein n=1 Tax=Steinernema carpocapsae TaxID=34508 RepID=A0A4U5PFB1_STECR|nr:hypothetical protein L596_009236 [Steinernema carpocapsae]
MCSKAVLLALIALAAAKASLILGPGHVILPPLYQRGQQSDGSSQMRRAAVEWTAFPTHFPSPLATATVVEFDYIILLLTSSPTASAKPNNGLNSGYGANADVQNSANSQGSSMRNGISIAAGDRGKRYAT